MTCECNRRYIKDLWGSSSRRRFLSSDLWPRRVVVMTVTFTLPSVGLLSPSHPLQHPQIHPLVHILNNTGAEIHPSLHKRLRVSFFWINREFQASLHCTMRRVPLFSVTFLLCLGYLLCSGSSWFLYSTRGEEEHQGPSLPLNFSSPCCFPKGVPAAKYILDYEEPADLYRFVFVDLECRRSSGCSSVWS